MACPPLGLEIVQVAVQFALAPASFGIEGATIHRQVFPHRAVAKIQLPTDLTATEPLLVQLMHRLIPFLTTLAARLFILLSQGQLGSAVSFR